MFENIIGFMKSQQSHDDFALVDTNEKNIITYDPAAIGDLGYKKDELTKTVKILNDYSIEVGK